MDANRPFVVWPNDLYTYMVGSLLLNGTKRHEPSIWLTDKGRQSGCMTRLGVYIKIYAL